MDNQLITDDQLFLLTFIFTVYFGPDMKAGPAISISERGYRQLPPYEFVDLASSSIRATELERIFCYILRKAEKIHEINLFILHNYLLGYVPEDMKGKYLCFSHFYPSYLHPYRKFSVVNIAFVHNPNVVHIRYDLVERFRNLSRVHNLVVDRNAALSYNFIDFDVPSHIPAQEAQPVEQSRPSPKPQSNVGKQGRKAKKNSMGSNNDVLSVARPPRMVSGDKGRVVVLGLACLNNSSMRRTRKPKKGTEALPSSTIFPSNSPMNMPSLLETKQEAGPLGTQQQQLGLLQGLLIDSAESEDP